MGYIPFSDHYNYNAEDFFNHDEVKEAQDILDKYYSQSARDDFKAVEKMRRAGDSNAAERLMHDWCAHHEVMPHDVAVRVNDIRGRLGKCAGAAVSDEVYDETQSKILNGMIRASMADALFDEESAQCKRLFNSLREAIHFQYNVAEQVRSAPWVSMTDDELTAFAEEWEQQRRIDDAIAGIREIASGQKTMRGQMDFRRRWPQVFKQH